MASKNNIRLYVEITTARPEDVKRVPIKNWWYPRKKLLRTINNPPTIVPIEKKNNNTANNFEYTEFAKDILVGSI
jgi:hypothetical protein